MSFFSASYSLVCSFPALLSLKRDEGDTEEKEKHNNNENKNKTL